MIYKKYHVGTILASSVWIKTSSEDVKYFECILEGTFQWLMEKTNTAHINNKYDDIRYDDTAL